MNASNELAKCRLFEGLEHEDLTVFAGIAVEKTYAPHQEVYAVNSAGDSLYVIAEGDFGVEVADENDEQVEVAKLKVGSYFGEMEVLGGMGRTAAVVAATEGRCYRFDAAELLGVMKKSDRLAAHFYRQVSLELIKRLKDTTRNMGYFKSRAF